MEQWTVSLWTNLFYLPYSFKICFKTTTDTTVQWLQYRILHIILPVQYYLKKLKAITDACCTFRKEESETIYHVFLNCKEILPLWSKLSIHILRYSGKRIVFHVYNILFGETSLGKDNKIVNFIILCTKQYIYLCLKQKRIPTLCELFWSLNTRLKNMSQSKNYNIQLLKNGGQHGKI